MKFPIYFCLLSLLLACGDENRRSELRTKELEIIEKQHQLTVVEKDLIIREQKLVEKEKLLDSMKRALQDGARPDSIANDTSNLSHFLTGTWNVSLVCTQSTCENFAVGDGKSEVWKISNHDNQILAEVVSGAPLVRVFTGSVEQNSVNLTSNNQFTDSAIVGNTEIRLKINKQNIIAGERELIRENCRVIYSIRMEKQ